MNRVVFLLVSAFLLAAPADAEAECVLSGAATIDRVRITPRGAQAFELGVDGHEVRVQALPSGRLAVESTSALEWSGTATAASVHLFAGRTTVVASGVMTLRSGASLGTPRLAGSAAGRRGSAP